MPRNLTTAEALKEFHRRKARLRDAILHDERLTSAEQRVGYEIADRLNFRTGDAWPSQEFLAQKSGYCVKTVERATKVLAGNAGRGGLWFTRERDGNFYRYAPKFDPLAQVCALQSAERRNPTLAVKTPDIRDRNPGHRVGLSSLRDPKREPHSHESATGSTDVLSDGKAVEQEEEGSGNLSDHDETITAAAARGGAPRFIYLDSDPWRAWAEFRERQDMLPMPTRQHMVTGRWRTGWDVPTLWPPGYGPGKPRPKR